MNKPQKTNLICIILFLDPKIKLSLFSFIEKKNLIFVTCITFGAVLDVRCGAHIVTAS